MADLIGLDLGVIETAKTRNTQGTGKPLDIPLADIAENPDNPRTEFADEHLTELAADIEANGVKSPVSIRKNPTGATPWVLNYGACRRRASLLADKQTIPAFIDEQFSDYDAVAENEQRRNLTAMELALFIKKRLDLGDKQKDIATRLHKDAQAITHHLALIDMPEAVAEAYREGRITTARPIYDLVQLHKQHADDVAELCRDTDSITRVTVKALADTLKQPEQQQDLPLVPPKPETEPNTPSNNSMPEKAAKPARSAPLMLVSVKNRPATIDLKQPPTDEGRVWVRYQDDNSTADVKASTCKLIGITDAAALLNNTGTET